MTLDVGGEPAAVVARDVTGDGHADLVVADQAGGRLIVLAGDGSGGFERLDPVDAGPNPVDAAVGDLDEDGVLDLAVANHETDRVTLLRGIGGGRFEPMHGGALRLGVSPHPHAVALADLDRDGHLDVLVDHRDAEGLQWLRGLGGGRFAEGTLIPLGGDPYRGFEVVDIDGDGALDLIAPVRAGAAVRLGDGAGNFRAPEESPFPAVRPFAVVTGDLDGDGTLDLAVGSGESPGAVTLLHGDGSGGFREANGSPFDSGPGAKKMAAADLDGDGFDDLLVTSWNSRDLEIFHGGETPGAVRRLPVGDAPYGAAAADLDEDGRLDVAALSSGDGAVVLFLTRD